MGTLLVISGIAHVVSVMYIAKLIGERHESDTARAAYEWEKMRGLREDSAPPAD